MEATPAKFLASSLESSQAAPVVMPAKARTRQRMRVLVVEDNVLNQQVVLAYLEGSEYDVTLAGDGREGVEAFERERFDVVLMDWEMPEMDGLDATRRIRAIEQGRAVTRTPIIAVTAHGQASDREMCLAAGMDDYVVKPYSFDALMYALRHWTSHR